MIITFLQYLSVAFLSRCRGRPFAVFHSSELYYFFCIPFSSSRISSTRFTISFYRFRLVCGAEFCSLCFSLLCQCFTLRNVFAEQEFEKCAHERLDEEKLGEICERQIEADELEPVCEQGEDVESRVIRVVHDCGEQAHRRAHKSDCSADDC